MLRFLSILNTAIYLIYFTISAQEVSANNTAWYSTDAGWPHHYAPLPNNHTMTAPIVAPSDNVNALHQYRMYYYRPKMEDKGGYTPSLNDNFYRDKTRMIGDY